MILYSLYKYGKSKNLGSDAYSDEPVAWLLSVNKNGKLSGLHFTGEKVKGRSTYAYKRFRVPVPTKTRTSGISPRYIVDKMSYIFGLAAPKADRRRVRLCHEAYMRMLGEVASRTKSQAVKDLAKCLSSIDEDPSMLSTFLGGEGKARHYSGKVFDVPAYWMETQSVAVEVDGRGIFEYPEVDADCRSLFNAHTGAKGQCCITGTVGPVVENHPPVKVPGTSMAGAPMISFNERSSESFGLKGNENAPVSKDAADTIASTMRSLLQSENNHYRLPSGSTILFWSLDDSLDDFYGKLLRGNAKAVKELFTSPYTGRLPQVGDGLFRSAIVRGEKGRIATKCLLVRQHEEVLASLRQHYDDIDIGSEYPVCMPDILGETFGEGSSTEVSERHLYTAIVSGTRYPDQIISTILNRFSIPRKGLSKDDERRKESKKRIVTAAYAKAWVNRCLRLGIITNHKRLEASLDEENKSVGYRMGALLAVLEHLRRKAIPNAPNIGSSAMNFFMRSPQIALSTYLPMSQHHVEKIGKQGVFWAKKIDKIMAGVDRVPDIFDMTSMAEFVVGYHHQREDLYKQKGDADEQAE